MHQEASNLDMCLMHFPFHRFFPFLAVAACGITSAAADEIDEYLATWLRNVVVVQRYVNESDQVISCVDVLHQPGMNHPSWQGPVKTEPSEQAKRILGNRVVSPPATKCPAGTAAMVLPTREIIFDSGGLDRYLGKGKQSPPVPSAVAAARARGVATPSASASTAPAFPPIPMNGCYQNGLGYSCHAVGQAYSAVPKYTAATSIFNIWKLTQLASDWNLSQFWLIGTLNTPTPGMTDQTIEAGWQQAPWRHGNNATVGPELFLYAAIDQTTHCYNTTCGFIAAPGNVLQLGQIQTNVSQLGLPGVERSIAVLLDPSTSDWDVYNYDIPTGYYAFAGYYPHALWGTGPLSGPANRLDFGGEAYTGGATAPLAYPRPPMGSTLNPLFATVPSPPENYLAYHHNIAYSDSSYVIQDWFPTFIPLRGTPETAMTGYPVGCVYGAVAFSASPPVITGWGAILVFGGDGIGGGPGC